MKKLSETTARTTIGMMRSMASHVPISPFHLQAAKDMEDILAELSELRKLGRGSGKRNDVLEEVALEFEKMKNFGDTSASFAVFVRSMKK